MYFEIDLPIAIQFKLNFVLEFDVRVKLKSAFEFDRVWREFELKLVGNVNFLNSELGNSADMQCIWNTRLFIRIDGKINEKLKIHFDR